MQERKIENAKIKMKYFSYLKDAEGLSPKTISIKERIITNFEKSEGLASFKNFSSDVAIKYKQNMFSKKPAISLQTISYQLNTLQQFFKWLILQPGYKHNRLSDVKYFNITRGDRNAINTSDKLIRTPEFEHVLNLLSSIPNTSELNKRDRAIIIFLLLSGIRVDSLIRIPIGAYDRNTHIVTLNPLGGVKTKFSKVLRVQLLPFKSELLHEFDAYVDFLVNEKKYDLNNPLFPATKVVSKIENNRNCFEANTLSKEFWKGTNSVRDILKKHCKAAGLEYFSPHSYRRLHMTYAERYCVGIEEYIALSQNLGHENLQTTYRSYGKLSENRKHELLSKFDFSLLPKNDNHGYNEIKEDLKIIKNALIHEK
jgi:integrase